MKMSNNPAEYEILTKQYLSSILEITAEASRKKNEQLCCGRAVQL